MSTAQYFNGELKPEKISVPEGDVSSIEITDISSLTSGQEYDLNNSVGLFVTQTDTLTKTYDNTTVTERDSHIDTSGSLIKTERGIIPTNEYRMTSLTGTLTGCTSINVTGDGTKFTYYDGTLTIKTFHGTANEAIGMILEINDYMTTTLCTGALAISFTSTGIYTISCVGSIFTYTFTSTNPFPLGIPINVCMVFTGTAFVLLMDGLAPAGVYSGTSEVLFPSADLVIGTFDGYIKNVFVSDTSENIGLYYPFITMYSQLHDLSNYLLFPLDETVAASIPPVTDTEGDLYTVVKLESISLAAMWGAGKINNCLTIQNVACPAMYVNPQPISMSAEFTIEVWLNTDSNSYAYDVMFRANCYRIRFTGSKYTFTLGTKTFTTVSNYNDSLWHQIVICYDGSSHGYIYIDGTLVTTQYVYIYQDITAMDYITESMTLSGGKRLKIDNIIYSRMMYSEIDVLRRYYIVTSVPAITSSISQCALTNDLGSTFSGMYCVSSNPGTLTYTTNGLNIEQTVLYNPGANLGTVPTTIEFTIYFNTISLTDKKIFKKGDTYYLGMQQGEIQFHVGTDYVIRYEYYILPATSYYIIYCISGAGYQLFIDGNEIPVRAVEGTFPGIITETVGSLSFGNIDGHIKKIYEYSAAVDSNYINRKKLGLSEFYALSTEIERFHVSSTTTDTLYTDKGTTKTISIPLIDQVFEDGPQGKVIRATGPGPAFESNFTSDYTTSSYGFWISPQPSAVRIVYQSSQFSCTFGTDLDDVSGCIISYVGFDNILHTSSTNLGFWGQDRYIFVVVNINNIYVNGVKFTQSYSSGGSVTKLPLVNYSFCSITSGAPGVILLISDIYYYPRIVTDAEVLLEYNTRKFTSDVNYSPIRNVAELITTYKAPIRLHFDERSYGSQTMSFMSEDCRDWIRISTVVSSALPGHFGKGIELTNTNQTYVSFIPNTTAISIGIWVYFKSMVGGEQTRVLNIVLDDGPGGGDPAFMWSYVNNQDGVNDGKLIVTRTDMNSIVAPISGTINYKKGSATYEIVSQRGWHFLVFTYNKLYLDGVLQVETTSSWIDDTYAMTFKYIGMFTTIVNRSTIDEFYYYPYDISQAEVTFEYNRTSQYANYPIDPSLDSTIGSNWNPANSNLTNGSYCDTNYLGSKTTVSNYTYLPFTSGFSIEFISNAIGYVIEKMYPDGTNGYYINVSATDLILYYRNGTTKYVGTHTADDRNKHIVITCPTGGFATPGNVKLYIDSILTALTSEVITVVSSAPLANVYPKFGVKTVGTISRILYYNYVLSPTQVIYRYNDLYDDRYSTGIYYNMTIDPFDMRMFTNIQSMAFTYAIPANTNIKFLMIVYPGYYYKFSSGTWILNTPDTATGNTYAELAALTPTQWHDLIIKTNGTIGIKIGLYTSDDMTSPTFTNLIMTYKIYKQISSSDVPMYYISNYGYMTIVKNATGGPLTDLKVYSMSKTK